MKKLIKCEICGSKKIGILLKGDDKLLGIPGKFSLFKCKNCKVIFLNPQPTDSELEKHYPNGGYYSLKNIDTQSKKLKLKLLLYKIYFNKKDKDSLLRLILSPLKFIARGTKINQGLKLLDIGSGSGQFIYEMKRFGMEVYGVEPGNFNKGDSKKYGLNIKNLNLIKAKYPKEFFNLITINHVFEHISNPNQTIIEIKRILKKDGLLIMGIPNTHSLSRILFGKNWLALDIPRHLFNYSPKNITYLLEKSGFKVTKIRYNSRPSQFVVSLRYLLGFNKKFEKILDIIFLPLTWIVNAMKVGDQIEVWCEKR